MAHATSPFDATICGCFTMWPQEQVHQLATLPYFLSPPPSQPHARLRVIINYRTFWHTAWIQERWVSCPLRTAPTIMVWSPLSLLCSSKAFLSFCLSNSSRHFSIFHCLQFLLGFWEEVGCDSSLSSSLDNDKEMILIMIGMIKKDKEW